MFELPELPDLFEPVEVLELFEPVEVEEVDLLEEVELFEFELVLLPLLVECDEVDVE